MDADKYLKTNRKRELRTVDDKAEHWETRLALWYKQRGRLEAALFLGCIDNDKFFEMAQEWNKHFPKCSD